jgi:hypothetical protein
MTLPLTLMLALAMLTLVALGAVRAYSVKAWKPFLFEAAGLALFSLFLHWLFGFPVPVQAEAKGPEDEWKLVVVLFISMMLGMLAQAFYEHFSLARSVRVRKPIDWGLLFAPVCASPIVFIPLLVALQNANIDLRTLTVPRMMIFLVAFQNGFFWKEHFDRKRTEVRQK